MIWVYLVCPHLSRRYSNPAAKVVHQWYINAMDSTSLMNVMSQFGAHNYHPLPVVLSRGEGSKVWDVEGREYLDFLSCYSALNFGHQHPRMVKALLEQVHKIAVCSRAFYSDELALFSKELAEFCRMEMVLAMNSGAEAVETAIKVARKWGYLKKNVEPNRAKILTFQNNFHGRTIGIISFSSEPAYRDHFGPFLPGFEVVAYNNLQSVEKAIDKDTVGILVEPIQAEAGILVPKEGYLKQLRKICTEHNILLMLDEIQTGLGRTGTNFCFQSEGISPDILILGKSLGGGLLPISAVVSTRDVLSVIRPGEHGSTFGGNPLACRIAREVIKLLDEEKLASRAAHLGNLIFSALKEKPLNKVKEVRGRGALVGVELKPEVGSARPYTERMAQRGLLCKETHENVIRIAPPLTIAETDLRRGLDIMVEVLQG